MSALAKINDTYYFRLRIPKDILRFFPRPEIVKSVHTKKHAQAKGLVRGLLGKTEELFMLIRSKTLDGAGVAKIVREFIEETLELRYDSAEMLLYDPVLNEAMQEIYTEALGMTAGAVRARSEVEGYHTFGFTRVTAEDLCYSAGYEIEKDTPAFRMLVHQLAIAKHSIVGTFKERLDTGNSGYDAKMTAIAEQKTSSNTLSEAIAAFSRANGKGHRGKLDEKMRKITEAFQFVTGKGDILLSAITYDLTVNVGHRLAKYPLYRGTRYAGKTLQEIDATADVETTGETTLIEELGVLNALYDFAIKTQEGLLKNFANGLGKVIIGKRTKKKASSAKDIFRAADIQEIVKGLHYFKDKREFHKNPHLLFITLIGLYSGARINEICQLTVDDIELVDGIPCFNHKEEEKSTKSLKNSNSIRINPIHPMLINCGLLVFRDYQKAKGYSGLWEGSKNHSCDYYKPQKNCSHYVGKWWNGTFKAKLTLSNESKQTYHSARHTFINWFKQNVRPLDYEARNALSGHLDKDDIAAMERQGYKSEAESEITYAKDLNVRRQMELLEKLDYGIDLKPLFNGFGPSRVS